MKYKNSKGRQIITNFDLNIIQNIDQQKSFSFKKQNQINIKKQHEQFNRQIKVSSFVKKIISKNKKYVNQIQSLNDSQQFNNLNIKQFKGIKQYSNQQISKKNVQILSSQYDQQKKLEAKINFLNSKINGMKTQLDKKREERLNFIQNQIKQRNKINFNHFISNLTNEQNTRKKFITQVPQHKQLITLINNPYSFPNSIYYVSQIIRAYKIQKSLARQHLLISLQYIKLFKLMKIPDQKVNKIFLPKSFGYEDKKTIIFDLDQTLIHCTEDIQVPSDLKLLINFPTGQTIHIGINIRPYAKQILASLSKFFQIVIFTASHSSYANVVIDHLDPQKKFIQHRLFRQHCYCTPEGIYVKDLRILNRSLSKVILIDNAPYSYAFQLSNGVPILPYYQGKNDYQLAALQNYVQSLLFVPDVRQINKNTFKLDQYSQFQDLNILVNSLYNQK